MRLTLAAALAATLAAGAVTPVAAATHDSAPCFFIRIPHRNYSADQTSLWNPQYGLGIGHATSPEPANRRANSICGSGKHNAFT